MKSNWQTKKLGEICDFQGGSQPPKSNFIYEARKGYVRFLQIRDFASDKHITYIPESEKNRLCDENDVLLGRYGASVGKILVNKKGAYNVAVMKTIPDPNTLNKDFLCYYLMSDEFQKRLSKVAARSAQAGFSKDDIYNFPVLTPLLSEQKWIVAILDEVFKKTAKVKNNAEKNLQNARKLFESYLQSIFANPRAGWEVKTLGKIVDIEYGYTDKAKVEGDYRYIRITDIDNNGFLKKEGKLYIKASHESKKFLLEDGDLLMARTGATFAKVLFFEKQEESVFASYLIRIKFKLNIKNKLYWYFSKSKLYWDQAQKLSSGSAQPQFNGGALKQVKFSYPNSLSEQDTIIKNLDMLAGETKKLEGIYQQKLTDLEELKKSILQKAFKGGLVGAYS